MIYFQTTYSLPPDHLNLLMMTATMRMTSTVMIAIVTNLLVTILGRRNSQRLVYSPSVAVCHQRLGKYLLAMPRRVLLLRSV